MSDYPWDYIDQMNGLLDSKLEGLTPSELYLYMKLFQINNSKHRVEWFELKNRMLSAFIDKDEKSMIRLRNSLQQKGLIEFKPGKKGQPTEYKLVILYKRKNTGKNASKNASVYASENASTSASICASTSASEYASEKVSEGQCLCGLPDPLKGKGKGKDNTPLPPKGDVAEPDTFLEFWQAYPRKVGKPVALKAYRKLNPSCSLHAEMMEALEKQKASVQWQKDGGQYIPHPSTWLNQRRWEDEQPVAAQPVEMQPKRRAWIPTADELAEIRRLEAEYEH